LKKVERAKGELESKYKIKNMKEVEHILGIKIEKEIRISQKVYTTQMLKKFSMVKCKLQSIPLLVGISLSTTDSPKTQEKTNKIKKIPYYETLKLLIWL